jgi:hypothetical protein
VICLPHLGRKLRHDSYNKLARFVNEERKYCLHKNSQAFLNECGLKMFIKFVRILQMLIHNLRAVKSAHFTSSMIELFTTTYHA